MKKKIIGITLILLLTLSLPLTFAKPPSGSKGKSNNASLLLVKKTGDNWDPVWPGAFGQVKYKLEMDGFSAKLCVHDLEPEKWYLVTLDAPFRKVVIHDPMPAIYYENQFEGSDGLFGVKEYGSGINRRGYIDVALFKTNEEGDANVMLPTTSGLTAADLVVPQLGTGELAEGTYTEVKIAVKYVGANADGSTPDLNLLYYGGYIPGGDPDAKDFNLYEMELMQTFTVE